MVLVCTCGAKLKIGDEKLTDAGVRIKCPKCGTPHVVKRPAPAAPVQPPSPAMPWFASSSEQAVPQPAPPEERPATASPPAMPWFAAEPEQPKTAPAAAVKPALAQAPAAPAPAAPAMPWFASSPEQAAAQPAAASPTPLLLVAHDSTVVVDMIRNVVGDSGLLVEHAPDGLDALKKASTLKPQVMIVDVGLTGIYGFELCERLKGDPETRGIKIILLSSVYGLTAYKRNPVTLYGADDYIEKHHIPDKLMSKIQDLLAGRKAVPPAEAAKKEAEAASAPAPVTLTPRKEAPAPPVTMSTKVEAKTPPAAPVVPSAAAVERKPAMPDADDVLPKVPVTLDGTRRLTPPPASTSAAPAAIASSAKAAPSQSASSRSPEQDASVKLDALFFEQDEYQAPAKEPVMAAVDPAEVEKARRFARLVVSDIVLYNQEAVAEGIAKGTFFELLKDDIAEGRTLYDKRVPEPIRANKDYFQEAFDNFIATKKKQR